MPALKYCTKTLMYKYLLVNQINILHKYNHTSKNKIPAYSVAS